MSKQAKKHAYKVLKNDEKNRVATLEIELGSDVLESYRDKAIKAIGEHVEINGFRKGAAPAKMIVERVGEMHILEEMAQQAIYAVLPDVMIGEKIDALLQPRVSVTKIAAGNPLVFKAEFVLMPEIKLADYKKIAKSVKADEAELSDKEVNDYIDYVRKSRGEAEHMRKKTSADKTERETALELKEAPIPELNDDFVKTLGDFKDVAEFKKVLTDNMKKDKEHKMRQKRRLEIIEKIIEESKIELPDALIEDELDQMMHQFKHDISSAKMDIAEYLKEIKKTEADMRAEWRGDAVKRVKMNLIVPKIALEEKITADEKEVEHQAQHLREHHKDISEAQAKSYVSYSLRNEAVFNFLEGLK